MSYIPEDSGVSFFDVAGVSSSDLETRRGPMLQIEQQQQQDDDFEPAAEPSSTSSNVELYDSFEEAAWLESRTVPVLPERLEADPILHSGAVSTAPSSRPHSPGIYKSQRQLGVVIIPDRLRKVGYIVEPLSLVAESISPDEARSFDARRAGDKEPVRAAVGPSVLPNSWTPTPKKVEYRATSAAVHPLSKSERCPPSRLSHPMSPQQQRQASVKVVPAAVRMIHVHHHYPLMRSTMTGQGRIGSAMPMHIGDMTVNSFSPVVLQPLPSSMLFHHV
ncbi:hypothetical protein FOZ60_015634 [Perkinsus olseni]|uniref:Uncharacterized protein n=1 Tax=Perkinsus olseni TaxID=32597 RepID=A0A7J6PKT1_PEROL|nr:hypothetical protein FOZ60_015634 [Perkinsus olseni]